MPASAIIPHSRRGGILAGLALLALIAGCAKPEQSSTLYDSSRENTRLDAESKAMGDTPRGASQIHLGFGGTGHENAAQAQAQAQTQAGKEVPGEAAAARVPPRPLAEARSFLGTVPCPPGTACEASRFVVTLAPSGEWRARTTLLVGNRPGQNFVEQGCWNVIRDTPLRIALQQAAQDTVKADLSFLNSNTLRVNTLNGVQPVLEHRLTRQADIDPIDELKDKPALKCL